MRVSRHDLARGGRSTWELLNEAVDDFTRGGGTTVGAAVAFYAVMSAAPLLVISVSVAGLVFGRSTARVAALESIHKHLGPDVASVLARLMEASQASAGGGIAAVLGVLVLLWAAGRLFIQLQEGLNAIFGVRPRAIEQLRRRLGAFIRKRLLSFAMVACCGLVLGAVLFAQMALSIATNLLGEALAFKPLWHALDLAVTLGAFTLLFAALYRVLPDATLGWRDTWIGASFTAVVVGLGVWGIGLWIGYVSVDSTHGAAGSLVLFVLWVYYSAQIFFFGAACTRAWSTRHGTGIEPEPHAVRVLGEDEIDAPAASRSGSLSGA